MTTPVLRANRWRLSGAQLFSGLGTATGFAVGGILAEQLTGGTQYAGFSQTASILGAGALAIPLAALARTRSRRIALSVGFGIAVLGAVLVVIGAATGSALAFFPGMLCFGAATATGLQSRYAAMDGVAPAHRARAMSIVVWATTIGSVAGPNLAGLGGRLGERVGIGEAGGPFLVSAVAFALAACCTLALRRTPEVEEDADGPTAAPAVSSDAPPPSPPSAPSAPADSTIPSAPRARGLRAVLAHPRALQGLGAVVLGHTIMVSVMVMTPVHLHGHGAGIQLVGVVISLHVLGMYAFSPLVGAATDRFGPVRVIHAGFVLFALALGIGFADGLGTSSETRVMVALILLGLGWSACFIAGSALLTASVDPAERVGVQGLTDACMNIGAAMFAAGAGPLLALGGFALINGVAAVVLAAGIALSVTVGRRAPAPAV